MLKKPVTEMKEILSPVHTCCAVIAQCGMCIVCN